MDTSCTRTHLTAIPLLIGLLACQGGSEPPVHEPAPESAAAPQAGSHIVDVVAEDYAFQAPERIPSGWVTFRMRNAGEEHHFALLTRLPEGKTLDDYMVDVAAHFDRALQEMRSGVMKRAEAAQMLGQSVPTWFSSAERTGGPGLLAPGATSEVTLYLQPGEYFLECYMKTPEGEFHGMEGMVRPLVVTSESSGAAPPSAATAVSLTRAGIEAPERLTPGRHTVAIHFVGHPDNGPRHDLHVARLNEDVRVTELVPWMDWMNVPGLQNPAPATFLGGSHEMPAGATVYATVDLEPGRYAWISQMTAAQGALQVFTVR